MPAFAKHKNVVFTFDLYLKKFLIKTEANKTNPHKF